MIVNVLGFDSFNQSPPVYFETIPEIKKKKKGLRLGTRMSNIDIQLF